MKFRSPALLAILVTTLVLVLTGCSSGGGGGGNPGEPAGGSNRATTEAAESSGETDPEREEGSSDRDAGGRKASGEQEASRANEPSEDGGDGRPGNARPAEPSGSANRSGGERSLASYGSVHTVTEVTDGDTVEVEPAIAGRDSVRLLLMDTPETYGGEEPLGPQATAYAERRLEGRRVALETDEEELDPYDRALAYIWLPDGTLFNAEITRRGLAQLAVFEPNIRYESRIRAAQTEAREAGRGIWSLPLAERCELADRGNPGIGEGTPGCGSAPGDGSSGSSGDGGQEEPSGSAGGGVPPASEDDCPGDAPIKGNEADDGELIYHPPGGAYYDVTDPEECFASASSAEADGYRTSER